MPDIRADLAQYYSIKSVFEQILGQDSYKKLKDYGSLKDWKLESTRLLKAISLAINETVEVADIDWREEIKEEIQKGISLVKSSHEIDELFSRLAATLTKIVFLQIGFIPRRHGSIERITLIPRNWKLNIVRTVQYVQNEEQHMKQKCLLNKRMDTQ
jgi:hypothetical protein